MKIDPKNDGVDHINIYSRGKTRLGRFLSNFAHTPIETEDGPFQSIEGYWYWLSTYDEHLRTLFGWEAKWYGRQIGGADWVENIYFKEKILKAIDIKLTKYHQELNQLRNLKLPLRHYYVKSGKIIEPKSGKWILDHLNSYRLKK